MPRVIKLANLFFAGLAVAASLAMAQQKIRELDLSLAHVTEPRTKIVGGSGSGGGIDGDGSAVQVVKISVMNSNLARCSTGEVEITIQISNLGGKRMTLPWNPDGAEVVDPARNPTFHDLAVTILEPNGTDRKIYGSVQLFGAVSAPNSEIPIEPGETVRIRNIKVHAPTAVLCSSGFIVFAQLSIDQLIQAEGGFSLNSRPVWVAESH